MLLKGASTSKVEIRLYKSSEKEHIIEANRISVRNDVFIFNLRDQVSDVAMLKCV